MRLGSFSVFKSSCIRSLVKVLVAHAPTFVIRKLAILIMSGFRVVIEGVIGHFFKGL